MSLAIVQYSPITEAPPRADEAERERLRRDWAEKRDEADIIRESQYATPAGKRLNTARTRLQRHDDKRHATHQKITALEEKITALRAQLDELLTAQSAASQEGADLWREREEAAAALKASPAGIVAARAERRATLAYYRYHAAAQPDESERYWYAQALADMEAGRE